MRRLQIQRSTLKVGEKPNRRYDPAPLLEVSRLVVSAAGCVGWLDDGSAVIDVHHLAHPAVKSPDGRHGISIGFTGHYEIMRGRFGPHVYHGVAGENILLEAPERVTLDELVHGVGITSAGTGETIWLTGLAVAHPCKSFSRYCLDGGEPSADALKETLQFLDEGLRGFYASVAAPGARAVVRQGDHVVAAVGEPAVV